MIDLSKIEDVRMLQADLRASLGTTHGQAVIKFLEQPGMCGWYDFSETDPNQILIKHGKRQILATIKTLLELTPDQIVALAPKEFKWTI